MKTAAYEDLAQGPMARAFMETGAPRGNRKKNGYPFTTFTDLSDFLGIYAESLVSFTGEFTDILGKSSSSLVVPVVVVILA